MKEKECDDNVKIDSSVDPKENDVIQRTIGSLGKWQIFICLATVLVKFGVAFHLVDIVVLAPKVDFRCENITMEKCSASCTSHVFDKSTFSNTITMQWDLVCEKQYLESVAQTLTMFGTLCGSSIFGYLSDRFGRKKPLVWAVALQFVAGVLTGVVPWYYLFVILRFLTSVATAGTLVVSFVIMTEVVGLEWRTKMGIFFQIPFVLGQFLISLLSYLIRDWQYFQIAISAPSILLLSYYWILPESPRWLLAVGDTNAAVEILKKAATVNQLPIDHIETVVKEFAADHLNREINTQKGNALDLLRNSVIRKYTIIFWLNWMAVGLCFYGGSQYMGQIKGNIFENIAISAFAQSLGIVLCYILNIYWGRKSSMILGNFLSGTTFILTACIPEDPSWMKPTLAAFGVSCCNMSFATLFIYAGEIYPTVIRNIGLGSCSTVARIGSMLAPFIANLTSECSWLPPVIFGASMLFTAAISFSLPETFNSPLPESIQDVEELEKQKGKSCIPEDPSWMKPTLAAFGVSCCNMSFATLFIYAGEIYPTVIRNIGLGSCSTVARIGSMLAPFIANLTSECSWLPPVIFGASMLFTAAISFSLPETFNSPLPESIQDVEELEKQKGKCQINFCLSRA